MDWSLYCKAWPFFVGPIVWTAQAVERLEVKEKIENLDRCGILCTDLYKRGAIVVQHLSSVGGLASRGGLSSGVPSFRKMTWRSVSSGPATTTRHGAT